jgi:hypothetical protein
MSVAEEERTNSQHEDEGLGRGAALKAAGAAAATGAAALAVQKMLAGRSKEGSESNRKERKNDGQGSVLASAAAGGWDAARDALMPLAESAAGAAGKYLAEHAPDIVRERVVPRFIDAFNDARG